MLKNPSFLGISVLGLSASLFLASPARADKAAAEELLHQMEVGYQAALKYQEATLPKAREEEKKLDRFLTNNQEIKKKPTEWLKKTKELVHDQDLIKDLEARIERSKKVLDFIHREKPADLSVSELRNRASAAGEKADMNEYAIKQSRVRIKALEKDPISTDQNSLRIIEENKKIADLATEQSIYSRESKLLTDVSKRLAAPPARVETASYTENDEQAAGAADMGGECGLGSQP